MLLSIDVASVEAAVASAAATVYVRTTDAEATLSVTSPASTPAVAAKPAARLWRTEASSKSDTSPAALIWMLTSCLRTAASPGASGGSVGEGGGGGGGGEPGRGEGGGSEGGAGDGCRGDGLGGGGASGAG